MADISATQASKLAKINRNTVNVWYRNFREKILEHQEKENGSFHGEVELDESYFGGPRKKIHAKDRRKRGRGAENKVPVFGIKKRDKLPSVLLKVCKVKLKIFLMINPVDKNF